MTCIFIGKWIDKKKLILLMRFLKYKISLQYKVAYAKDKVQKP